MTKGLFWIIKCWWIPVCLWACAAGSIDQPAQPVHWSVAIFDYENVSPANMAQMNLGELLTAKAIETVSEMGRYQVVERQQLALILDELQIGSSMIADRQTQLKLGDITGARLMVFGYYQVIENQLRLDVRLVEVESGRVINAVSHVAEEHNLPGWLDASAKSTTALFNN